MRAVEPRSTALGSKPSSRQVIGSAPPLPIGSNPQCALHPRQQCERSCSWTPGKRLLAKTIRTKKKPPQIPFFKVLLIQIFPTFSFSSLPLQLVQGQMCTAAVGKGAWRWALNWLCYQRGMNFELPLRCEILSWLEILESLSFTAEWVECHLCSHSTRARIQALPTSGVKYPTNSTSWHWVNSNSGDSVLGQQ